MAYSHGIERTISFSKSKFMIKQNCFEESVNGSEQHKMSTITKPRQEYYRVIKQRKESVRPPSWNRYLYETENNRHGRNFSNFNDHNLLNINSKYPINDKKPPKPYKNSISVTRSETMNGKIKNSVSNDKKKFFNSSLKRSGSLFTLNETNNIIDKISNSSSLLNIFDGNKRERKMSAPGTNSYVPPSIKNLSPTLLQLNFCPTIIIPIYLLGINQHVTLCEAIKENCKEVEYYNLDLDRLEVHIENSTTALPLNSPIKNVAGFKLYATVNHLEHISPKNQKTDDELSTLSMMRSKTSIGKEDILGRRLLQFNNQLPSAPIRYHYHKITWDKSITDLEETWDQVINSENVPKKEIVRQNIIWEILNFEANYALRLKKLFEIFICPLLCLVDEKLIDLKVSRVTANLVDVYIKCSKRWNDVIAPFINEIRETKKIVQPSKISILYKVINSSLSKDNDEELLSDEYFSEAYLYNLQIEGCEKYIKAEVARNLAFRKFYIWANQHHGFNKLDVTSYLKGPMQHLTRLSLPIERLLQCTEDENDKYILEVTISRIKQFVGSMNQEVHKYEQEMILWSIEERIEGYEIIDGLNEEFLSQLPQSAINVRLTTPMFGCNKKDRRRRFIEEGPIKMKEHPITKMQDVYLLLFSDILLITKKLYQRKNDNKLKLIKAPMRLDKLQIFHLRDRENSFGISYQNESGFVLNFYTFYTSDSKWYGNLINAKKTYIELISINNSSVDEALKLLLKQQTNNSTELLSLAAKEDSAEKLAGNVCMTLEELESRWPLKMIELRSHSATVAGGDSCQLVSQINDNLLLKNLSLSSLPMSSSSPTYNCRDNDYTNNYSSQTDFDKLSTNFIESESLSDCHIKRNNTKIYRQDSWPKIDSKISYFEKQNSWE